MRRWSVLGALLVAACGVEEGDGVHGRDESAVTVGLGQEPGSVSGLGAEEPAVPNGLGRGAEPGSAGIGAENPSLPNGLGQAAGEAPERGGENPGGEDPGGENPGGENPGGGFGEPAPGGGGCDAACAKLVNECGFGDFTLEECRFGCPRQASPALIDCVLRTSCDQIDDACD